MEVRVTVNKILGIHETDEGRKIEFSYRRVASWSLAFTNAFFISYFFAKLFHWI